MRVKCGSNAGLIRVNSGQFEAIRIADAEETFIVWINVQLKILWDAKDSFGIPETML